MTSRHRGLLSVAPFFARGGGGCFKKIHTHAHTPRACACTLVHSGHGQLLEFFIAPNAVRDIISKICALQVT